MRRFRLDLRAVFRRFGKEEQQAWAEAVAAQSPKKTPDDKGTGGSLPAKLKATSVLKVRAWGFALQLHTLGQKLTWFVRGTKRQKARPVEVETDIDGLAATVEAEAQAQFSAWDRSSNA
ncbi:MAG TPA: hypothetical protein DEA08_29705 [Planctomycetes bacterium]|nr:hypothetical protein [Planctomycetota bacterium]|tara:strand:+ start:667 stop:1023 length:357 start_codon:yes stop_codon:yes gene_type:complete